MGIGTICQILHRIFCIGSLSFLRILHPLLYRLHPMPAL